MLFRSFFRPLPFHFQLLSLCFFLSALPGFASQWLPRCALPLSLSGFPLSLRPDFSCLPSRFSYSAFLFVSFRPSLIRSHSRFSGASLLLSLSGFPLASAFFRPLPLGSDYSASVSSFPYFPASPHSGSSGAASPPFSFLAFPLPSGLFPCLPSDSGTRLAAIPFSLRRLASQQLLRRPSLLPFGFRPFPLAFALGSGYSASVCTLSDASPFASNLLSAANKCILPYKYTLVNTFF